MDRITLLDTSVGSTNRGDEIIMECMREELTTIFNKYFILNASTHLASFTFLQSIFKLPDSANEIYKSKYKFVGGTNLFCTNMLHRCCQWNIDYFNCKPIKNSIFVGVGINKNGKINFYTKKLYKKVLSHEFIHSVREENAEKLLLNLGFKAINTGCITLWKLKPDYCEKIPKNKSEDVIFTLTDYNRDKEKDLRMIEQLKKSYNKLYFWVQGIYDLDYLKELTSINDIEIIDSSLDSYKSILMKDVDYVGTRLHAGIFAMRAKKRAIIVCVDDRMNSMRKSIKNNCISRKDIHKLNEFIDSEIKTVVDINFEGIKIWKSQFD